MNNTLKYSLLLVVGLSLALALGALPNKPPLVQTEDLNHENDYENHSHENTVEKAVELVNSGQNPMQGILMLKEIAAKDPTNIEAITQLAFFSIKSGQLDKAIERFKQIERLDSNQSQAFYFLGNLYLEKGNKTEALTYFKKFKEINTDKSLDTAIDKQIKILTH